MADKKSPFLAGFLNFILAGTGYIYAGKRVGFGVGLLIVELFFIMLLFTVAPLESLRLIDFVNAFYGVALGILFAYDGYKTAQEVNNKR